MELWYFLTSHRWCGARLRTLDDYERWLPFYLFSVTLILFKKQLVGVPWRMGNLKMKLKQWKLTERIKKIPQLGYMSICNRFQSMLALLQTQSFIDSVDVQFLLTWCLLQSPWESSKMFWEKVISFPWDTCSFSSLFLWWLTRLQSYRPSWCEPTNRSMKAAEALQCCDFARVCLDVSSQTQSCASLAFVFAALTVKRASETDGEDQ